MPGSRRPRVFVDADVIFAGAAGPTRHGASLVVLRMAEITLIEALTSHQALDEAERNLEAKLPQALSTFRLLVDRCLRVVPDPRPQGLAPYEGMAHPKDLPILACALREGCPWLVTFNGKDFEPGHPELRVLRPGEFVLQVRDRLVHLTRGPGEGE
jgi:uncharacterized protein